MEIRRDALLQETLYAETMPGGLTAYVLPKPGYQKKFATLATHYGSIDNNFITPQGQEIKVPDGIAHFLEHKLFEGEDGNAADFFAELGASSNAFTNYTSTTYLFSATSRFPDNLDLLLRFVGQPYFTPENVEKEKGIIEQELRMYLDDPNWRVFHNLLGALFQKHPVRIDIGGTVESIRQIDAPTLNLCYDTFYHPSNMTFFAVGDIDPQATLDQVRETLSRRSLSPRPPVRRLFPTEPAARATGRVEDRMLVSEPLVEIGFKEQALGQEDFLARDVLTGLLLDAIFGKSSPLYTELYEAGLIDDRFSASYFGEADYGASILGGESPDPERLLERIQSGLERLRRDGIPEATFRRIRRKGLGEFLGLFNSPEAIAYSFNAYHFKGYDFFDFRQALEGATWEAVNNRLREHLVEENLAVSVIWPAEDPKRT